jgi:hypothetical protein
MFPCSRNHSNFKPPFEAMQMTTTVRSSELQRIAEFECSNFPPPVSGLLHLFIPPSSISPPARHVGSEPFFSKEIPKNFFQKKKFGKSLGKILGKNWKKVCKPEETPKEHFSSATICPTLS